MECDVQISKDGHVVVAHDDTLERMCGEDYRGKRVRDFNFDELPKF
jgi:glycerophosphoryl diester phosphodiesterase